MIAWVCIACRLVSFAVTAPVIDVADQWRWSGPFCGVYSCLACVSAIGIKDIPPEKILNPEFVGSIEGSSGSELIRFAESLGAAADPYSGLPIDALAISDTPALLHVRQSPYGDYNHWFAYLGTDESGFRLFDSGAMRSISAGELLTLWDGSAIFVHRRDVEPSVRNWVLWRRMSWVLRIVIVITWVHAIRIFVRPRLAVRWLPKRSSSLFDLNAIFAIAVVVAVGVHLKEHVGFANNMVLTETLAGLRSATDVATVEVTDVNAAISLRGSVVLVDVRLPLDFARGTISTAINIPANMTLGEKLAEFEKLPSGSGIIVFCQSSRCAWAGEMANLMVRSGMKNVRVYSGGYSEWRRELDL